MATIDPIRHPWYHDWAPEWRAWITALIIVAVVGVIIVMTAVVYSGTLNDRRLKACRTVSVAADRVECITGDTGH